jgi:hypothetical protein
MMSLKDFLSEGLGCASVGKNTRESVIEVLAAGPTEVLMRLKIEIDLSKAKALMAYPAVEGVF